MREVWIVKHSILVNFDFWSVCFWRLQFWGLQYLKTSIFEEFSFQGFSFWRPQSLNCKRLLFLQFINLRCSHNMQQLQKLMYVCKKQHYFHFFSQGKTMKVALHLHTYCGLIPPDPSQYKKVTYRKSWYNSKLKLIVSIRRPQSQIYITTSPQ